MNWLAWKAKLYAVGGALLALLAFIVRFKVVKGQRDRFKRDADTYKAQVHQAKAVTKVDSDIEQEYSDLKREAKQDMKNDQMPKNIRDRNVW